MRTIIVGLLLVAMGSLPAANAGKPPGPGGGGTAGVVAQNLGVLPGDKYSDAWDVNANGHAVGRSYNSASRRAPQLVKAFYWADGMHRLDPATVGYEAEAHAINSLSSGTETAVGFEWTEVCPPDPTANCDSYQNPVVWTGNLSASPTASTLPCATNGAAFGINDDGNAAVGVCGDGVGAIWSSASAWAAAATEIHVPASVKIADASVPFPDGHFQTDSTQIRYEGTAWDVSNNGIVVGTLVTIDTEAEANCLNTDVRPCQPDVSYSRSYIYISSSGTFAVLPTPESYKETSAYAVSNTTAGTIFVAGWTGWRTGDRSTEISQAIRWTVDASTGESTVEDLLTEQAWAEGVTQDGLVAGTHNSGPNRRGNITQTATLWNESVGYIPLKPPGGSDSTSRAMAGQCLGSTGPIYVVGEANVSGAWTAARWEIQCSTASP